MNGNSEAQLIYIDQNHWVGLLREDVRGASERLRAAASSGQAIIPLSATHYLETWHRSQWRSRHVLAAVMQDISGWTTIAPIQAVIQLELHAALTQWFELGDPGTIDVIGRGVNHAFDCATGRFRVVQTIANPQRPEGPGIETPELFKTISQLGDAWEWFSLAGPKENFPIAELGGGIEYRPEHDRGTRWAAWEEAIITELDGQRVLAPA